MAVGFIPTLMKYKQEGKWNTNCEFIARRATAIPTNTHRAGFGMQIFENQTSKQLPIPARVPEMIMKG